MLGGIGFLLKTSFIILFTALEVFEGLFGIVSRQTPSIT